MQYEKHVSCANGHTFDFAKQGYLNLLLAQHKKSLHPGDNKEMVKSRYDFLSHHYYMPIADAINQAIKKYNQPENIVDVGCGIGYYLAQVQHHFSSTETTCWGLDISKEAVQLAAQKEKKCNWLVSNAVRLPFQSYTIDTILSVFSPIGIDEIKRVLARNGVIIVVTPASQHLIEFRKILFEEVYEKDAEQVMEKMIGEFDLQEQVAIQFPLHLKSEEDIKNLLKMTPFFWRSSKEKQEMLMSCGELDVSVDVILWVFTKRL